MKLLPLLLCLTAPLALAADEKGVTPAIDSVGMFKNGLAVVRVSFPVAGPGLYRWEKIPHLVHGSLWVESDGVVAIQSTTRMVETTDPVETPVGALQRDLAGKKVTVTLKSDAGKTDPVINGTVWDLPETVAEKSWQTDYSSLNPNQGSLYWFRGQTLQQSGATLRSQPTTGNFLVLTDPSGNRRYLDQGSIASVSVAGPFAPAIRHEEKPVLVFDVSKAPAGGGVVRITYLTKGIAWLPSYQLDLTDPTNLKIRQNAVVRNEMGDLRDTEIQLISGYPNVRFGSVDSPMWPGTGLSAFFQQVNQSGSPSSGIMGNSLSQQAVYTNFASTSSTPLLPESPETGNVSDDIHYESIGARTMKAGDSLSLDVAAATTKYDRVVEWKVPDPRDERGRYQVRGQVDEDAWDAVRFTNPFTFPMTTAAASIVEGGKFRGQSQAEWVNPGQQACLRITRALSVRTEAGETEEEGEREIVFIGGNDYQRTKVKGHLAIHNFRSKEVTVTIRCEFSGELVEADGDPAKSLRTEGVSSVNPRRRLDWTVKLPPGGEKTLEYRYQVLVDR